MVNAYQAAKEMAFYKIDCANRRGANHVNYAIALDVPKELVRSVSGQLANNLRKLGYKVRFLTKETLTISWDN